MTELSDSTPTTEVAPPSTLPVFPLTGTLLLPGSYLPLNIFEPRYRNLVADVLEGDRCMGMIQPVVPRQDNRPDPALVAPDHPDLYGVGCAGVIEKAEKQEDGRYLILLRGLCRFRVEDELPVQRGYRRVRAAYGDFRDDFEEPEKELEGGALLAALEAFGEQHQLSFDMERLKLMPGVALLNGLSVALPFPPGEKQALLEAESVEARREMLLSLMGMGLEEMDEGQLYSPPPVN